MIKFALPGMYEHFKFNARFIDLFNDKRNYFYDNVEIEIVYGNPQFSIWDGGRIFHSYKHATVEKLTEIIDTYNNTFNLPIRYVFTSCQLKPEHYSDRFSNILLDLGSNYNNQIVVADDNLRDFIASRYDNYKFVSSTTKCLTDKELAKKELDRDDYNLVCLDYNLNHDINFLKSLSEDEINKTELLVNAICAPACPFRKEHYRLNSIYQLNYGKMYKMEGCTIKHEILGETNKGFNTFLSYDDITSKYEPLGLTHFKIEGRTWDELSLALTYCEYMVKPEYKDTVLLYLLK